MIFLIRDDKREHGWNGWDTDLKGFSPRRVDPCLSKSKMTKEENPVLSDQLYEGKNPFKFVSHPFIRVPFITTSKSKHHFHSCSTAHLQLYPQ